jgi:hypothetical protein
VLAARLPAHGVRNAAVAGEAATLAGLLAVTEVSLELVENVDAGPASLAGCPPIP